MITYIWESQIIMGIMVNLLVAIAMLAKRYIPVLITKYRIKKMKRKEIKFVAFQKIKDKQINRLLTVTCIVLIMMPYVFTLLVILSLGANKDE